MIVREDVLATSLARRFTELRQADATGGTPGIGRRLARLASVERIVKRFASDFIDAVNADFGHRSAHETRLLELFPIASAARHARRHLARWMADQQRPVAPHFFPARARVAWQPFGVVGIVVPWNYPLLLALQPLVSALAAGNRAMIKMSEYTPQTAGALARAIQTEFALDEVRVESGGIDAARAFAALPFDHLLFTGSSATGRSVMRAAARNLTPVTLELGGKSPVIIGRDADLATAAARIMSGKCRNAGQSCIAPDYALVPHDRIDAFIAHARRATGRRFARFAGNPDYTSIATAAQFDRLTDLLADARLHGATVVPLHHAEPAPDAASRTMPPVAVTGVSDGMRIMTEEIFGPLLPVRAYRTLDEAVAFVNARPHPLALYYFGSSRRDIAAVIERTRSGGLGINDVVLQFAQDALPFGGVGESGMGAYHGRAGFERLSHQKAIFEQRRLAGSDLLEPPYGARFAALLRLLSR